MSRTRNKSNLSKSSYHRIVVKLGTRLLTGGSDRLNQDIMSNGDIVAIYDTEGTRPGCDITNYSSSDIGTIKGTHSRKITSLLSFDYGPEVVYRNNLALLEREEPSGHR